MRIGQLILEGASLYERKSQALDAMTLADGNDVIVWSDRIPPDAPAVDVIHVYGPATFPARIADEMPAPYVAAGGPRKSRFRFKAITQPARRISATGSDAVPEAVEDQYFQAEVPDSTSGRFKIGSFGKSRRVIPMIQASISRVSRFRDDIDWDVYETVPSRSEFANLKAWVDPVVEETDHDGLVAEAVVAGIPVVATKTEMNRSRLADGRAGFLVPMNDPNELVHAILAALFKPEFRDPRLEFAANTRERFRRQNRARRLRDIYAEVAG